MPVDPDFDLIREVGTYFDETGAHPFIPDVDVEHQHRPVLLGERELRAPARIGSALGRGPYRRELLRPANRHHLRHPSGGGLLQIGPYHLRLAITGLEPHHRHPVGLRPGLHVLTELRPDRLEQRRRRDRLTPVIVQEVDHPAGGLQLGHEPVEVQPVQAGDVQRDVTGHHVGGRHHRPGRHGRCRL